MALALADSLGTLGWNIDDQARRYVEWSQTGKYSVNGRCFDIGITTSRSLSRFQQTGSAASSGSTSGVIERQRLYYAGRRLCRSATIIFFPTRSSCCPGSAESFRRRTSIDGSHDQTITHHLGNGVSLPSSSRSWPCWLAPRCCSAFGCRPVGSTPCCSRDVALILSICYERQRLFALLLGVPTIVLSPVATLEGYRTIGCC